MTSIINDQWLLLIVFALTSFETFVTAAGGSNLSCYQCTKKTNEECGIQDLRPCPPISDRCVTHISKNAEQGFTMKRECGLGPCSFSDTMVSKGLGWDSCDRSNDEYFCVFCCKESGCNQNTAFVHKPSPPYILQENEGRL